MMACCTRLPYFSTAERCAAHTFVGTDKCTDELVMYESSSDDDDLQDMRRRKCSTLHSDVFPLSPQYSTDNELTTLSSRSLAAGTCPISGGCCLSGTEASSCPCCAGGPPLLNDCMWSAGMLPPDLMAAARHTATRSRTLANSPAAAAATMSAETLDDAAVCTGVDPSLVSPCPPPHRSHPAAVTSSTGARHVSTVTDCTPPASDPDDDDDKGSPSGGGCADSESSDEVDVVSVQPSPLPCHDEESRRLAHSTHSRHSTLSSSAVRELLTLPPAYSVLACVTAMHNYSSGHRPPSSGHDLIYSAPQSPSVSSAAPLRHRLDRSASTPASPTASRRRRVVHRRRRTVLDESSASDDSDGGTQPTGGGGKRAHHNVLERRRRDHLKWSFEALRGAVPGSAGDVRVPKVAILRRARDHIRQLSQTSQRLYAEYAKLRSLHQRWLYKLELIGKQSVLPEPSVDYIVQPAA